MENNILAMCVKNFYFKDIFFFKTKNGILALCAADLLFQDSRSQHIQIEKNLLEKKLHKLCYVYIFFTNIRCTN